MRKHIMLALATAVAGTPAFAGQPATGQGFRIEAIAGYDSIGVEGRAAEGISYGLGLGYDFRIGGMVAGVEAEAGDSAADGCFPTGPVTLWRCASGGRDLYAGGRVGALVGGNVLLYAKAGYANSRLTLVPAVTLPVDPPIIIRRNLDGIRAGAGIEIGVSGRAFIKTEYRYTNYADGFDRHQVVGGIGFRF